MTALAIHLKRILRLALWLVVAIASLGILVVGFFFLRSDIYSFRPYLPKIKATIEAQRRATPVVPPLLSRYMELDASFSVRDRYVAKQLLGSRGHFDKIGYSHREVRISFCRMSLAWHLTVAERELLHLAYIWDGHSHHGVHHLAQRLHGKSVEQLNEREIAELVIAEHSPMTYLRSRKRLTEHANKLLLEANPSSAGKERAAPP